MRILPSAAGLTLVALLLTGCLPPQPIDQPTPQPSSTPVFASDEDALAAAEAAYARYSEVSSQIFSEGGVNPERLESVATGEYLEVSIDGFEKVQQQGYRSVGLSTFSDVVLQQYTAGAKEEAVVVYLCDDVSGVDVLDSQGNSVVLSTRPDRTKFQVSFDLNDSNALLVSGREVWNDGAC